MAKIRADAGYEGETATSIPGGVVKVTVRREPKDGNVYRVTCEARFPEGVKAAAVRTEMRSFKRIENADGASIVPISESP